MFRKPMLLGLEMGFSAPFRLSVKRMLGELDDFTGAPLPPPYTLHGKVSKMRDISIILSNRNMKYLHPFPVNYIIISFHVKRVSTVESGNLNYRKPPGMIL